MTNKEVASALDEIAMLLELTGENPFKTRAYTNMARKIEGLDEDIEDLAAEKRLRDVGGVGEALEQKITELVENGRLQYLEDLKAKFPPSLFELFGIQGLGPKRIKMLYDDLGIDSLDALEKACHEDRIASLKGMGKKSQDKILEGIAFARKHQDRRRLDVAHDEAAQLVEWLRGAPGIIRLEVAGSLRRSRETVKDVDVLVSSGEPGPIMDRFVAAENVARVTGKGDTKSSVVLQSGMNADLRVVSDTQFPFALAHFTGSKQHNVVMRQRAKDRGLKLNEYGLFKDKDDSLIACKEESDIYKALDLPYIPPEMREDMGEFDLEETPKLIEQKDLKGVIHNHSTWSDGKNSIEEMALAAKQRGFKYFGLADHSRTASYAGGLTPERVEQQHQEIDALNKKLKGMRVLKGIESDILNDGSLDYDEAMLKRFDFIVASVHSNLKMSIKDATKRILAALENPYTTILGHPTGRLLLQREGYELDWDEVFKTASKHRVAIEINANPRRLDLDWRLIRRAKDAGCMFCIGPDAHVTGGLDDVRYGIGIARKGGLNKDDLLNCLDWKEFTAWKNG